MTIFNSSLDLIGNTPIVKLPVLSPDQKASVYVKLEFQNPGGSIKDRIALGMIEQAEQAGRLLPGGTIIEPTSGNTGIGLALVGSVKGYETILVMPETMSIERRQLMQAYGAKIVLTPGKDGMKGAIAKATELATEHGYFMPMQFANPANPQKHAETTAKEIIKDFTELDLSAFVAGVGTGGTLTGVGQTLKNEWTDIKVYAVEPAESAVLSGENAGPHKIQGIGAGFIPDVLKTEVIDEIITVPSEEAMKTARLVAQKAGFLVGVSGGAAINAALKIASQLTSEQNVLTVVPDNGERYLSTGLYEI